MWAGHRYGWLGRRLLPLAAPHASREFLQAARNQTPGEPDRAFRVLVDRECSACDRLGIRADLAKPSTYVLDTHGNVVYAYVGETSTDRPSVKAVLDQLDRAD